MIYEGKKLNTIMEVFDEALRCAKTNKDKASDFFKAYVEHILNVNDEIDTYDEAEEIAKSNLGYFAGYCDKETIDIIYKIYQCSHPIFGNKPYDISPEEAFEKGMKESCRLRKK